MSFCISDVGALIRITIGYVAISSEALPFTFHYKRSGFFAGIWFTDFKSVRDNEFYFLLIFYKPLTAAHCVVDLLLVFIDLFRTKRAVFSMLKTRFQARNLYMYYITKAHLYDELVFMFQSLNTQKLKFTSVFYHQWKTLLFLNFSNKILRIEFFT